MSRQKRNQFVEAERSAPNVSRWQPSIEKTAAPPKNTCVALRAYLRPYLIGGETNKGMLTVHDGG